MNHPESNQCKTSRTNIQNNPSCSILSTTYIFQALVLLKQTARNTVLTLQTAPAFNSGAGAAVLRTGISSHILRTGFADRMRRFSGMLSGRNEDQVYYDLIRRHRVGDLLPKFDHKTTLPTLRDFFPGTTGRQRMMAFDAIHYLPDDILVKVDRAGMAVSLEGRVPMLDHRVVEFAFRLPMNLKYRDGQSKWILRKLLARRVPLEMFERPKMGFGVPLGAWLRGPLREWGEDLLSPQALRDTGVLNTSAVRRR